MSVPNAVYVIIGSSGEYSDRDERVIGYVLTEADAMAAVEQAEAERSLPDPIPYPTHESTHEWVLPDGTICPWLQPGARFFEKSDAAEIAKRREAAVVAWKQARIDAGRIDPDGSMDSYYYEVAPAIAMVPKTTDTPTVSTQYEQQER